MTVRDGAVADIDLYVGGRWRERAGAVRDLGTVAVDAASDFLLRLAEVRGGDLGPDAIGSVALADSVVVWPRLLGIARDAGADRETRKAAVFWLSMRAGERATEGLTEIASDRDDDREVREVALFSLSQLPGEEGVTALLQVARTSDDPDLKRHAIFWLGQSEDPRALDFLVEVLER